MDLSKLKPVEGSTHSRKRIARGQGCSGDTAGRGHKGAKSRSGYKRKLGFEGGQMPIYRRLPKYGFKNRNRVFYRPVNIGTLQELVDEKQLQTIDFEVLQENGLANKKDLIKILGNGELKAKLDVTAHAFSKSAIKAIEDLGGSATKIEA
ncbi:MAG TPA: 50S ribosomal protein L15 [Bacteroidales bacterium]|nr:50S ribosomal protein L15 [Bacteroidales bacterium]